jgi:hypothetical protein
MIDWIHALPLGWMALVVFGGTMLVTAAIYWIVIRPATEDRLRTFKGISPGLVPALGIIFGLLVAFSAGQVWGDIDRANAAVNHEASALRTVVLLSRPFPGDAQTRLRSLVSWHIRDVVESEWPAMARRHATLSMTPAGLGEALELAIALPVTGEGQVAAQREIVANLNNALDARRQRILVSRSEINWVKWLALILQAVCTLLAIAMLHCDNRATARFAMGLFATATAVCIFLLLAHDRPFTGQLSVPPTALLEVRPESPLAAKGS